MQDFGEISKSEFVEGCLCMVLLDNGEESSAFKVREIHEGWQNKTLGRLTREQLRQGPASHIQKIGYCILVNSGQ